MNFKEASKHLYDGKRIRRNSWPFDGYLSVVEDNKKKKHTKYFRKAVSIFNYDLSIFDSEPEWQVIGEDKLLKFSDVIEEIKLNKKVKLNIWKDAYLESCGGKALVLRQMVEDKFVPTFECLIADDWIILENSVL